MIPPRAPAVPDAAASEVVGNVLMIGITVLLAASLAYSLSSTTGPGDQVHADLSVEQGTELNARHVGGEAVPVDGSAFILTYEDDEERIPLADFPGDVDESNPDRWELDERVCISCQASDTVQALTFVTDDRVVLDWHRTARS